MVPWTPDEDRVLFEATQRLGSKWHAIAGMLPRRTASMVRNRYLRVTKAQEAVAAGKGKNRCQVCGQIKAGHTCTAFGALVVEEGVGL